HEGAGGRIDLQRPGDRLQHGDQCRTQGGEQGAGVGELARLHALAQAFDQGGGGGDPDVGGQQRGLDLVQQVVVELGIAREQAAEAAGEGAVAQAFAPAGAAGRGGGGFGWRRDVGNSRGRHGLDGRGRFQRRRRDRLDRGGFGDRRGYRLAGRRRRCFDHFWSGWQGSSG